MALNLDGLELSEEVLAKINEQNAGLVSATEIEGLKKNRDDLLAEKKAVQDAKTLVEQQAEIDHIESLKAKNDNKALAESYQAKLAEYEKRDKENAQKIQKQAVNSKALEMAKTISDGDNAELLASFIEGRLRSDNGEIKVTDVNGGLTISTQEDLLNEFKANQRYAALVTVTKADGGRTTTASNGHSSASSSKKPYSDMTLKEQTEYLNNVNPIRN
jgi:hypothetical protein